MAFLKTIRLVANHPLNRGHAFGAIGRYLKWQAASRLVDGEIIYEWLEGVRFIVRPGETGLVESVYTGLLEFEEMAFFLHYLRAQDLFIDVGANVGTYTMLACGMRGARAYAFEPVPATFERLLSNIRLNRLEERVRVIRSGLGEKRGRLFFTADENVTNHVATRNEGAGLPVPVGTLDHFLKKEKPTAMKIDVEGYETAVLRGGLKALEKASLGACLIETNGSGGRYGYRDEDVLDIMQRFHFEPFTYDPFGRKLIPLGGRVKGGGNTLFIRNLEKAQKKVAEAALVKVFGKTF